MKHGKAIGRTRRGAVGQASRSTRQTKLKKTFSLSRESVDFLKRLAQSYQSDSEALDALIREKEREAEKQRIDAAITNYYDTMSEEEREENRTWGEFVHAHLVQKD